MSWSVPSLVNIIIIPPREEEREEKKKKQRRCPDRQSGRQTGRQCKVVYEPIILSHRQAKLPPLSRGASSMRLVCAQYPVPGTGVWVQADDQSFTKTIVLTAPTSLLAQNISTSSLFKPLQATKHRTPHTAHRTPHTAHRKRPPPSPPAKAIQIRRQKQPVSRYLYSGVSRLQDSLWRLMHRPNDSPNAPSSRPTRHPQITQPAPRCPTHALPTRGGPWRAGQGSSLPTLAQHRVSTSRTLPAACTPSPGSYPGVCTPRRCGGSCPTRPDEQVRPPR